LKVRMLLVAVSSRNVNLYSLLRHNKSLDASGGSAFRKIIGPAMLE
jgi:hypothetical protein